MLDQYRGNEKLDGVGSGSSELSTPFLALTYNYNRIASLLQRHPMLEFTEALCILIHIL